MCWFHARKSAEKKLAMIANKNIRTQMLQDIDALQNAPSEKLFDVAAYHFLNKWKTVDCANMSIYLEYFEAEWLRAHKGWFVSYLPDGPSTNNGLEATNAVISRANTFRNQLSMSEFLRVVHEIVGTWSKERDPSSLFYTKPFAETRQITTPD